MRIAVAAVAVVLLVGCDQGAAKDLETCKADLSKSQTEVINAKTAQGIAEQKVAGLEKQVQDLTTQMETMKTEAAQKAAAPASTGKKSTAKSSMTTPDPNVPPPPPLTPEQTRKKKF